MRISYGKLRVPLQRVVANEDGRHDLLAAEVSIEVLGENFWAAYSEGDNREVVATDTMKNFILREALAYDGAALEGLLLHLGRGFLETYPVMNAVRMSAKEVRFDRLSDKLFARERGDHAVAMVELDGDGIRDHRSGREDVWMLKVTGSSFTRFARDEYTTLPERVDRPLFVRMDVHWRHRDPSATTSTRASCATSWPPPSTTSCRSRSSTWCTRWARGRSGAGRSWPRSRSRPRTTRATHTARRARASSTRTRSPRRD